MSELNYIQTPYLLVSKRTVEDNCKRMKENCDRLCVKLRPMMKTHKCLEAAIIATGNTKKCISVSTLAEAEFYANNLFDDILFTALFTLDKIHRVLVLHKNLSSFHVMIDSEYAFNMLEKHAVIGKPWSVNIKVDTGYQRAGIPWDSPRLLQLAELLHRSQHCSLHGLYTHEGHSYGCKGTTDVEHLVDITVERLLAAANVVKAASIKVPCIGLGATPTASHLTKAISQLTEVHPGNYIFYDVQQSSIGSCSYENIALRIITRVIGHYPESQHILIDAGFLATSHDGKGLIPNGGSHCVIENEPDLILKKVTQECGIVTHIDGHLDFQRYPIGSLLFLLPYHACATAAMHSKYLVTNDEGKITEKWMNIRGW